MAMFAKFETDPAGEEVMINVEKIVKFQEFGQHTSLFFDDCSTIDVKGDYLMSVRRLPPLIWQGQSNPPGKPAQSERSSLQQRRANVATSRQGSPRDHRARWPRRPSFLEGFVDAMTAGWRSCQVPRAREQSACGATLGAFLLERRRFLVVQRKEADGAFHATRR